jgi:integrase
LKPATVNRDLARARAMLDWAIGRELMSRNPIAGRTGLKQLRETGHRVRRLSAGEETLLLAAAADDLLMQARIIAALDTGMRRGEILKLQNAHVMWDAGLIRSSVKMRRADESAKIDRNGAAACMDGAAEIPRERGFRLRLGSR